MKNIKLWGEEYYEYTSFLCKGESYHILICKRLLIRPFLFFWFMSFLLGYIYNKILIPTVGFPLFFYSLINMELMYYLWKAINVKKWIYYFYNIFLSILFFTFGLFINYLCK